MAFLVGALWLSVALADDLPDPDLTPGVIVSSLTTEVLCDREFTTKSIRHVTASMHAQVYAAYGMDRHEPPCPCEVDHLISLELGGANDLKNLWPQSYTTQPWNARDKDQLENRLHRLVCDGEVLLEDVQHEIATDWIAAYVKYIAPLPARHKAILRRPDKD